MELVIGGLFFLLAALAVAAMGFAIQRGATCTVAAVDEVLTQRRTTRLVALVEASLWVTVGLAAATRLHWLAHSPAGFALTGWTIIGAVLLGLGAFVNRACVFGAIARLGSGDWAYGATPLGFYAGCLSVGLVFAPAPAHMLEAGSIVFGAADWVVWPLLVYLICRVAALLVGHIAARKPDATPAHFWSPHTATLVIGITFVTTLMLAGSWAYTDVLAELARGMSHSLLARFLLVLCLLLGALAGGWKAGKLRHTPVSAPALLRCFSGGVLMGWGSLLIPGSNDGLILIGMPLLWPYAWVAFGTMCLTIAGAQVLQQRSAHPAHKS